MPDLVRKDSIEELCGHRARALELYALALSTLKAAQEAHHRACSMSVITTDFLRDMRYTDCKDPEGFAKAARACIDRDMWRFFITGTPLGSLMDAEEKRKFEDALKDTPPEATPDTVFATMARLAGDANAIFRRGLVNAFRRFYSDFKSHDGFKIGRRFIIPNLVQPAWCGFNHYRESEVRDIDRCMHVLDGKQEPEYQQGICAAMRTAMHDHKTEAETEYWRVRMFANGNAHFYPLRPDLIEKANRLIAEHYGAALGAGHSARHARQKEAA